MSFAEWIITGAIFIIILALVLGIGWWIRNTTPTHPQSPPLFVPPLGWSSPSPGPNPDKNSCQLYQFPTVVVDINGIPTVVPGTPTLDSDILDNLTGRRQYPRCVDTDQIIAQQVQHTCTDPAGVTAGAPTRCFLIEGGTTGLGGTEVYYTNSGCLNIPPCNGQLSLVSVNYQAPGVTGIFCLQSNGTGANITMEPCDPSNPDQLFRVTRINPSQHPDNSQRQGQNGFFTQILHRDTGLCVLPGSETTNTIYDPNYLTPIDSRCSGPTQSVTGTNVILGPCTGGVFPGYVWGLLPSVPYCPLTGGCGGCTGCPGGDCRRSPGSNACVGCPTCRGFASLPVPPQIVNISGITGIPSGLTGYMGLTGSSAIIQWLLDNGAQSMYYGGRGNGLILKDIGLDVTVCEDKPHIAQYLNLPTYNTLIAEEVCLAEGTPFSSCIPL